MAGGGGASGLGMMGGADPNALGLLFGGGWGGLGGAPQGPMGNQMAPLAQPQQQAWNYSPTNPPPGWNWNAQQSGFQRTGEQPPQQQQEGPSPWGYSHAKPPPGWGWNTSENAFYRLQKPKDQGVFGPSGGWG